MLHICGKRYVDRVEPVTKITVYSNENEVELFANGQSVGKQKKGKYPFFYFNVNNDGETVLTVKAGELTDESKIRKTDVFNEDYRMKEEGGVINWFEIDTPPGYFSVNDTIGDILATAKGKLFALKVIKLLKSSFSDKPEPGEKPEKQDRKKDKGFSVMGFTINRTMIEMGKGFSVKRALMMANGMFTKEQILEINRMLNKIKKPEK